MIESEAFKLYTEPQLQLSRQRIDSALYTNTWFYILRIDFSRYLP